MVMISGRTQVRSWRFLLLAGASLLYFPTVLLGCNFPTDTELLPPPEQAPFSVVAVTLPIADLHAPQPINPLITIRLSDFPDPATVTFPAMRLGPRGQNIQYTFEISLVNRQILLAPRAHLLPETDYFLTLDSSIRSLSGRNLGAEGIGDGQPYQLRFHTGAQAEPPLPLGSPLSLDQLVGPHGPLGERCAVSGCHRANSTWGGDEKPFGGLDFSLPSTSLRNQLVSNRRKGPEGLLLVEPGSPELSYLLRKLLAASFRSSFLRIEGEPMPPAENAPPLSHDELAAVEAWIRQGAK